MTPHDPTTRECPPEPCRVPSCPPHSRMFLAMSRAYSLGDYAEFERLAEIARRGGEPVPADRRDR